MKTRGPKKRGEPWYAAGYREMQAAGAPFTVCTRRSKLKDGRLRIRCVRGLWSVEGEDRKAVLREATHYFQQYHADGEYAAILASASNTPQHTTTQSLP